MSDFNWVYPTSGSPWITGGTTVFAGQTHINKAFTDREYVIRPASGTTEPPYLTELSTRYLYDPSGWNS